MFITGVLDQWFSPFVLWHTWVLRDLRCLPQVFLVIAFYYLVRVLFPTLVPLYASVAKNKFLIQQIKRWTIHLGVQIFIHFSVKNTVNNLHNQTVLLLIHWIAFKLFPKELVFCYIYLVLPPHFIIFYYMEQKLL